MDALEIGKIYTSQDGETSYRLDAINGDKITATVLRGDKMPRRSVGKQRVDFCTIREFKTWIEAA